MIASSVRKNKLLIARANKQEEGSIPNAVPKEFLEDCIAQATMHAEGGTACSVHGLILQEEMAEKYPAKWMLWAFSETGWWDYE